MTHGFPICSVRSPSTARPLEASLAAELEREDIQVTTIGDCVAPKKASMAIFEGKRAASTT